MGIFDWFKSKPEAPKVVPRNFFNIQVGDVITYDEIDYVVKQVYEYNENGYRWMDYHLVDGNEEIWLGVDDDDGIELSVYKEVLWEDNTFPKKIVHQGVTYYLEEHGTARVVNKSDYTDTKVVPVEYADYEDEAGEKYLSLERWGQDFEASVGYSIKQHHVKIFPKG